MERADTGMLTAAPVNSRADAKVDGDIVSRFATCCRALGIAVYQRRRPADLAAARAGFTALTRIAHEQCDAWVGLAAAGDVSLRVLEAVSQTAPTAGVLQRQVELAPGALGFRYDTGLYLQFRATAARRLPPRLRGRAGHRRAVCRRRRDCHRPHRAPPGLACGPLGRRRHQLPRRTLVGRRQVADPDRQRRRSRRGFLARGQDDPGHRAGPAGHVRPRAVLPRGARRPRRGGGGRRRAGQSAGAARPRRRGVGKRSAAGSVRGTSRRTNKSKRPCPTPVSGS